MVFEVISSTSIARFSAIYVRLFLVHDGVGASFVALLVYVDDIIISGSNTKIIDSLKAFLYSQFKLKDLNKLKYFLDLEIARSQKGIFLS